MWQEQSYLVCLRGTGGAVLARRYLEAENDEEAAVLAAVLFDATSDVAAQCELWCGDRRVLLPRRAPTAAQLNAHVQRLAIDHEIALRDSRRQIADSRRLLEQIGVWSQSMTAA